MIGVISITPCEQKGIDFIHAYFLLSRGLEFKNKVYIKKKKIEKCIASMKLHNLD